MFALRSIVGSFLDIIYPPSCVVCGDLMDDSGTPVCLRCWSTVAPLQLHPELAEEALAKIGPAVDGLTAPFVFQKTGALQTLIHAMKYRQMERVGRWLGQQVGSTIPWPVTSDLLIVPVPLHRAKERERGYNQAALVGEGIAATAGGRCLPDLLRRTRHTRTQTKLSIEERRKNVQEAFVVDRGHAAALRGATVLIADDVITTGATIASCASALRVGGARRVYAAAVAMADHDA